MQEPHGKSLAAMLRDELARMVISIANAARFFSRAIFATQRRLLAWIGRPATLSGETDRSLSRRLQALVAVLTRGARRRTDDSPDVAPPPPPAPPHLIARIRAQRTRALCLSIVVLAVVTGIRLFWIAEVLRQGMSLTLLRRDLSVILVALLVLAHCVDYVIFRIRIALGYFGFNQLEAREIVALAVTSGGKPNTGLGLREPKESQSKATVTDGVPA